MPLRIRLPKTMNLTAALDVSRKELLELGARNRLVHTPLEGKRKSWVPIVDERTDQIFDILVRNDKSMAFLPADAPPVSMGEETSEIHIVDRDAKPASETVDFTEVARDDDVVLDQHTDLFLQTNLATDSLGKRLLSTFRDARTAEEEQGVGILYLACGFLQWTEAKSSSTRRFAPLLLLPVELTRNSTGTEFRLRFRDDEIVTNLSIQARLHEDFGITLPDLPDDLTEDEDWTPETYFNQIRDQISDREGWEIDSNRMLLWFYSFTKFLMFRDLSDAAWPDDRPLSENPLLESLLGDGMSPEVAGPAICSETDVVDTVLNPADVVHIADADSSQAVVIEEIARGRSLVVQGPPGTGKSQTITNAIAAAVHAGRKVLFVAEKMAALQVVEQRLVSAGLGSMMLQLHSHKARKQEVLEDLRQTFEQGQPVSNDQMPQGELRELTQQLRQHGAALHGKIEETGWTPHQALSKSLQSKRAGLSAADRTDDNVVNWSQRDYQRSRQNILALDQTLEQTGPLQSHSWRGVRCNPLTPADTERLSKLISQLRKRVNQLLAAAKWFSEILEVERPEKLTDFPKIIGLITHLEKLPPAADRSTLADKRWHSGSQVSESLKAIRAARNGRIEVEENFIEAAWEIDWTPIRMAIAARGRSWFRFLFGDYRRAVATFRGVARSGIPNAIDEQLALIDRMQAAQKVQSDPSRDSDLCEQLFGAMWQQDSSGFPDEATLDRLLELVDWMSGCEESELLQQHARRLAANETDLKSLAPAMNAAKAHFKATDKEWRELVTYLKLDLGEAVNVKSPRDVPLLQLSSHLGTWLATTEQLSHYTNAQKCLSELMSVGLTNFVSSIKQGNEPQGRLLETLDYRVADSLWSWSWKNRPELSKFEGGAFEAQRERFAALDQLQISHSKLEVARKHHANMPSSSANSGQVSLLRREMNKKRRHMPLRKLLREAGQAVQMIKPVFLMSPLSVSQYLEPGSVEFDVLIIDEASQVQPVDALGAVARCKQIVVVGDQKQLPPTNFFGRVSGGGDDEADGSTNAGDLESILGLCEAQGVPSRMLSWHYRSQHESLIAVSNKEFYDSRLFVVPSPLAEGALGVKFHFIENGCFDRGGSATNAAEAQVVAAAVMQHVKTSPDISLGVAAFSEAQARQIQDQLDLLRRDAREYDEFFTRSDLNRFFIKSLENVQGDERQVIFISIGYGKDKNGKMTMNFGPLNRDGGERRLNVLISRASQRCEVFSSIKAEDIDLSRTKSVGVTALKTYLQFAETGDMEITQSVGDADSIFEEQVAAALKRRGLEVDFQIGVGGFRIDLGIKDPENSGRYLMGIECDGAQYHSARWVRDRDRLRQTILESRGWIIHRIWSTDWFQRPDEQVQKVLTAVERARIEWEARDWEGSHAAPQEESSSAEVQWERMEIDEAAEDSSAAPYVECRLAIPNFSGGPADLTKQSLAQLIERIVEKEAPIHADEIGRRCISILGQGRLVASLKETIAHSLNMLEADGRVDLIEDFACRKGQQDFPVRFRKELDNSGLRKIDMIFSGELIAAVVATVECNVGPSKSEASSASAKLLGVSNSKKFQAAAESAIETLQEDGKLKVREDKVFVV